MSSESIRVLHVDDDPSFGELVADFLERENGRMEIVSETSASDGLDLLRAERESVDCVISDYDMPGMDGLEFLDVVRDTYSDLPFVLFTGKGSEEVASDAISRGATDYLQKGGGTEQYQLLANRVQNAVTQYRYEREHRGYLDALDTVHDITTNTDLTFGEKIEELLNVGREYLDVPYGFLTEIDTTEDHGAESEGTQSIVEAVGTHDLLQSGESCQLSRSYCRRTIQQDGPFSVHDAPRAGWEGDPGYELFDLGSYIGGPIRLNDGIHGTLCFAGDEPREREFSEREQTLVWFITQWTQYELNRQQKQQEIERQNERFDELASVVSHDLQTPIETVRGRVQLALETGDADHMRKALNALDRVDEMRSGLVETLRTKEIAGETRAVDIESVAVSVWESLDVSPDASLEIAESPSMDGDPDTIGRLLQNLFANSAEHGGDAVAIRIGKHDDGFYVEDDGPGIPPEDREDVFTPGFSTKPGGTGMGMTSVRQIVHAHDWQIEVGDAETLSGVRFEVTGDEKA